MKKFGLIGHPIGHSVSPAVFSAGYKGRPYTYDLIEGEDFEESYRRFIESYDGINVTAPFKELAFSKADLHSPECEVIGATNLLVKTPEGVKAYNSDYYGAIFSILLGFVVNVEDFPSTPSAEFCRAALEGSRSVEGGSSVVESVLCNVSDCVLTGKTEGNHATRLKKALIVGCGGAGKAAVAAAVSLGFETTLMNRTIDKAFAVADRIKPLIVRPIEDFVNCFTKSNLVIYTLPCPIDALNDLDAGETALTCDTATGATEEEKYPISHPPKVFIEANYRDPAFTPEIIDKIQTRFPEAQFIRGNIWHLYQAWSGYALFTGETPDLSAMAAVDK